MKWISFYNSTHHIVRTGKYVITYYYHTHLLIIAVFRALNVRYVALCNDVDVIFTNNRVIDDLTFQPSMPGTTTTISSSISIIIVIRIIKD